MGRQRERALLETDTFIPRANRVFTNRNLRLAGIAAIGFDLDHTLAHYDAPSIERLAFDATKRKLVEKRGYPEGILKLRYNPDFVVRGLIVDKKRGNVLKMDAFKYVRRAYHGRRLLSKEERSRVYRSQMLRLGHPNYVSVDTLFHLPEVYLYAALVDFLESGRNASDVDYTAVYEDVRAMIDEAHGDGSLKRVIVRNPGQFVRRDPKLVETLEEFRRSGKKLFLLTNSEFYYSDALLRHLLERKQEKRPWESYFDLLIVDSRKPGFFLESRRPGPLPQRLETRCPGPAYSGGDASLLETTLGAAGDRILYFGDHTYGDILRSKKNLGWRTAMIVSELEQEVVTTEKLVRDYSRLEKLIQAHDELELAKAEIGRRHRRLLRELEVRPEVATEREGTTGDRLAGRSPSHERKERQRQRFEEEMSALRHQASTAAGEIRALRRRIEAEYNPYWGSVFHEGNVVSRFGDQVRDFACVYTSRVSNLLRYPDSYFFQSPMTWMAHDL